LGSKVVYIDEELNETDNPYKGILDEYYQAIYVYQTNPDGLM
jgi:hypothetical protein